MLRKLSQKSFFSGSKIRDFHVLFENCLNVEKLSQKNVFFLDVKLEIFMYCLKTV